MRGNGIAGLLKLKSHQAASLRKPNDLWTAGSTRLGAGCLPSRSHAGPAGKLIARCCVTVRT